MKWATLSFDENPRIGNNRLLKKAPQLIGTKRRLVTTWIKWSKRDFVIRSLAEARSVSFWNPKWGKYGRRVIADVVLDGKSLAAILIERGLGRPYGGGRRKGWCQ